MDKKKVTNMEVKKQNRNRVFRYICRNGTVSNPDIAHEMNMSLPTVTQITKELIEKAEQAFDAQKAAELEQKLRKNKFTLADFYDQLVQLKGMGSLSEIAGMLPGVKASDLEGATMDEKLLQRMEAIASLEKQMKEAAKMLEFELAAALRDQIIELRGK